MGRPKLDAVEVICTKCGKHWMYQRSSRKGGSKVVCNSCCVQTRRKKLKKMGIDYLGGKCMRCGYDKSIAALEFHHKDRKEKSFSISDGGITRSWDKMKVELDKCVLVCANCHREIEEELRL